MRINLFDNMPIENSKKRKEEDLKIMVDKLKEEKIQPLIEGVFEDFFPKALECFIYTLMQRISKEPDIEKKFCLLDLFNLQNTNSSLSDFMKSHKEDIKRGCLSLFYGFVEKTVDDKNSKAKESEVEKEKELNDIDLNSHE